MPSFLLKNQIWQDGTRVPPCNHPTGAERGCPAFSPTQCLAYGLPSWPPAGCVLESLGPPIPTPLKPAPLEGLVHLLPAPGSLPGFPQPCGVFHSETPAELVLCTPSCPITGSLPTRCSPIKTCASRAPDCIATVKFSPNYLGSNPKYSQELAGRVIL